MPRHHLVCLWKEKRIARNTQKMRGSMCSDLNSFSSIIKLGFDIFSSPSFLGPVSYATINCLFPTSFKEQMSLLKVGPYTLYGNLEPNGWWLGSMYKSSSRNKWVIGRLTISQQVIAGWEIATAEIMNSPNRIEKKIK